jgi:hypothetical protein
MRMPGANFPLRVVQSTGISSLLTAQMYSYDFTAERKDLHSAGAQRMVAPSGSFESRITTVPGSVEAISIHSPLPRL